MSLVALSASESLEGHLGDLEDELEDARARARGELSSSSSVAAGHGNSAGNGEDELSAEEREAAALSRDRHDAQTELARWEAAGQLKLSREERTRFNLVSYWQVGLLHVRLFLHMLIMHQGEEAHFPLLLLFGLAPDVMAIPASAVPCERVFSSSKETCTLRRSRMSPQLMERLQILNFKAAPLESRGKVSVTSAAQLQASNEAEEACTFGVRPSAAGFPCI